jgi:hypothetical protein
MGPLEEKLRETLGELAGSEILDDAVESVLSDHCEVYALWAMGRIMAAQKDAAEMAEKRVTTTFQFHQGRIAAYKEIFARVAFDGLSIEEETLTEEQLAVAERVEELLASIIPTGG